VQKGLKDYLDSKCSVFARFYFLADADLLEILSQTKEVENVRPHLKKVFENMNDMEFNPDKTIVAMMSGENEKVKFVKAIDPKDKKVEDWMNEVENMMFKSVRDCVKIAIQEYTEIARTDWVLKHPGMCVLNCSQVHWTKNLEVAAQDGLPGVQKFLDKLNLELSDTVNLVRRKLTNLQSMTLGALIVIDVHARDVIKILVDSQNSDVTSFEWIS
jgi:dynein heavy chain, axonemal